jgi:hypothetical protein
MYTCEFCNKQLKSISYLNSHQKTTRYCLKLQNKDLIESNVTCCDCGAVTGKLAHKHHKKICIMKKDNVIEKINELNLKHDEYVKELESKHNIELTEKDTKLAELESKHNIELTETDNKLAELECNHFIELTETDNKLTEKDKKLAELECKHNIELTEKDNKLAELECNHNIELFELMIKHDITLALAQKEIYEKFATKSMMF